MTEGPYIASSTYHRLIAIALSVTQDDDDEVVIKDKIHAIVQDIPKCKNIDTPEHLTNKIFAEVKRRRRLGLGPHKTSKNLHPPKSIQPSKSTHRKK